MTTSDANIYAVSRLDVQQEFSDCCSGNPAGLAVVVFSTDLSVAARDALTKSFERLGYGPNPVTFIHLTEQNDDAAQKLFRLVEGLDPRAVVACDSNSVNLCNSAYRTNLPTQGQGRVLGRDIRTFEQLDTLLQTDKGKQTAWGLLKTLPSL